MNTNGQNSIENPGMQPGMQNPGFSNYYSGIDWASLLYRLLEKIHWILLAAFIVCELSGLYVKTFVTPVYETTSKLYIAGSETTISLSDIQLGSSLAKDYQEVFKIWHIHELVDDRLGLDYSYTRLANMVKASNPEGSHILYIKVRSSDPEEAQMLADTYADVVQEFIADKMEMRRPQVLERAQLPTKPVEPNVTATMIKGFLGGAALAAAVVILLYLLDDKIRTSDDVEKTTGLATFGVLAKQEPEKKGNPEPADGPDPGPGRAWIQRNLSMDFLGEESINTICSGILFTGRNMKRIAVTSHGENSGKTYVAMRIAHAMAKRGKKVLLVDADLRNSVMKGQYRIHNLNAGLAHLLSGQCSLEEALYPTNVPNLYLMPVGEIVKTPLPLLASSDFEHLMDFIGQEFDLAVVDTPPIGAAIDAAEIAKCCDGSLLVLEYNKVTKAALRYLQKTMEQTKTPVIGCVINKVTVSGLSRKRYYSRYGGYQYYYGDEKKGKHRKKQDGRDG